MLRKIARNMAKVNMKKRGFTKICKHEKGRDSYFSNRWRDFVR